MPLSNEKTQALADMATKLRIHTVESTTAAGTGHPTSCASMAEIMSVLFFNTMRYTVDEPKGASNDRFVLSKGHAAPILYAAWAEAGLFPKSELKMLRKLESDLEGHPTPRLNFVDVATGSLGQGLSIACGMAYIGKHFDKAPYRTFCLVGDGESYEGNVWEALVFAGYYKLDNLCVVIDVNRQGQSDPTMLQHDMETYQKRVASFGFNTIVVDGHDVGELAKAFEEAEQTKGRPTCVLAKTFKGNGFPGIADQPNFHGKALGDKSEAVLEHLKSLLKNPDAPVPVIPKPTGMAPKVDITNIKLSSPPNYKLGEKVAVRAAYGNAILKIAQNNSRVVALDGDMKNSTFSQNVRNNLPIQHIECFICEQNMAGVGIGVACRDRAVAFMSTFAAFFTRAFDNFRMGVVSQSNINVVGTHCGVSIGEDGPSQMALEDLAMFRSLPGCTVFYPSDAVACERAVELAANTPGICYIRVTRPDSQVMYANDEDFKIGQAKITKKSNSDKCLIIGAGVTFVEAMKAAEELEASGIKVRVMDPFTIKPLDQESVITNALDCGGRIVTVEDHYPEGGIAGAVAQAIAGKRDIVMKSLYVKEVPRSGPPMALVEKYGIDAKAIKEAVIQIQKE